MYTIIRGADSYESGRITWNSGVESSGVSLQDTSSCPSPDDRDILIDFTVRDNIPDYMHAEHYQHHDKMLDTSEKNDDVMVIRFKDKQHFLLENPNVRINQRYLESDKSSVYSVRDTDTVQDCPYYNAVQRIQFKEIKDEVLQVYSERNFNSMEQQTKDSISSSVAKDIELDGIQRKLFQDNTSIELEKERSLSRMKLIPTDSLNNGVVRIGESVLSNSSKQSLNSLPIQIEDGSNLFQMDLSKFKEKTDLKTSSYDDNPVMESRVLQKAHVVFEHQISSKVISPSILAQNHLHSRPKDLTISGHNSSSETSPPIHSNIQMAENMSVYPSAQKHLLMRNSLGSCVQETVLPEEPGSIYSSNHSNDSSSHFIVMDHMQYNVALSSLISHDSVKTPHKHVQLRTGDQFKNESKISQEKQTLSSFDISRDLTKNALCSPHSEEMESSVGSEIEYEHSATKLAPSNYSIIRGQDDAKKNQLFSVVHVNLPVKNVPSLIETALRGFSSESHDLPKSASSLTQQPIIRDSCISPQSFVEDLKIRNYSMEEYKQILNGQKQSQDFSEQEQEMEVLDFRLKDVSSSPDDSLNQMHSIKNSPSSQSSFRVSGLQYARTSSELNLEPHYPKINQQSVISQVRAECKVCNVCRKYFWETGYLNETEACVLCLYHAENGMKCVCNDAFIKNETCTCLVNKRYPCAYCDQSFSTTLLLQKHTFSHLAVDRGQLGINTESPDTELFECSVCALSFSTEASLSSHLNYCHKEAYCDLCKKYFKLFNQTRHSCDARYICNLCGAGFASNYNLKMHLLKHSGNLPYKCQDCGKSFAKPSELFKHSLVHSGERPYSCYECNMSFTSPNNLRSHKATHSGVKPHPCKICDKTFTRPADVKRHMLIHSGERPYACEICGLAFSDASNMRKHVSTHSKPLQTCDIKTYHCTYCPKVFIRPSELKRHFFTHTKTRPYSCHICGLAFTDSSNLKKHIQSHERASQHVCVQCESSFKHFDELDMHISLTHSSKRFDTSSGHTCEICGSTFNQLIDLQDHILSHGPTSTFPCDVCSKVFSEKIFLERHLLTHTESRPYLCNECYKSFKSQSHLRSHMLIHTGEKIHVCSICSKSFLKKSSLLRHHSVHFKGKHFLLNTR